MPNSAEMKRACAMAFPFVTHLTLPLRIMWSASIPCNVRHAVVRALIMSGLKKGMVVRVVESCPE